MQKIILICILALALTAVILIEQYTNIDVLLNNYFYDFENHRWVISFNEHQTLSPWFYHGAKKFVAFVGTSCVIYMISSIWIKKWRRNFPAVLTVLLCTIIIPTAVGQLKRITNVYCPNQLQTYEAGIPYVKIFEKYPKEFSSPHKGRCFPGGHVTGAFSLMSLYLVFRDRRKKIAALTFAVAFGFVTGTYQMLRGEHFISHNLFSMLIAGIIIILINSIINGLYSNIKKHKKNL